MRRTSHAYINPNPGPLKDQKPHNPSLTIITSKQISYTCIESYVGSSQQHSEITTRASITMVETRGRLARANRAANNVSAGGQLQTAAGIGTLDKLPPEIRNRIYKMVLVNEERVKLQSYQPLAKLHYVTNGQATSRTSHDEVAPVDHKRNTSHRCQQWDGKRWIEVPSKTALTRVNKQLHAETSSILYGFNFFDFKTTSALERFLKQIGNNKQHIRTVGLSYHPYGHSITAGDRAVVALLAAQSLHTLSLTNFPIEHVDPKSQRISRSVVDYVEMFAPVLTSLHTRFKAIGQGNDVLSVLKITRRLPGERPQRREVRCHDRWGCGDTCVWHRADKPVYHLAKGDCNAMCRQACEQYRERYEYLQAALKKQVANKLGLGVPSQDDEA